MALKRIRMFSSRGQCGRFAARLNSVTSRRSFQASTLIRPPRKKEEAIPALQPYQSLAISSNNTKIVLIQSKQGAREFFFAPGSCIMKELLAKTVELLYLGPSPNVSQDR